MRGFYQAIEKYSKPQIIKKNEFRDVSHTIAADHARLSISRIYGHKDVLYQETGCVLF